MDKFTGNSVLIPSKNSETNGFKLNHDRYHTKSLFNTPLFHESEQCRRIKRNQYPLTILHNDPEKSHQLPIVIEILWNCCIQEPKKNCYWTKTDVQFSTPDGIRLRISSYLISIQHESQEKLTSGCMLCYSETRIRAIKGRIAPLQRVHLPGNYCFPPIFVVKGCVTYPKTGVHNYQEVFSMCSQDETQDRSRRE